MIELIQPASPDSALARFMRERAYPSNPHGEGIYLVGVEVDDVARVAQQVEGQGGRIAREEESPNTIWVHPTSTRFAFLELSQGQG